MPVNNTEPVLTADTSRPVDIMSHHDRTEGSSVSLRDYIDARITGLDRVSGDRHLLTMNEVKRLDELAHARLSSLEKAGNLFSQKIDAQFKGIDAAQILASNSLEKQFGFISKSTDTATASLDKRLEGMNEFREQISDMSSKFITREDVESKIKYMGDRMSVSEAAISNCISRQEMNTQIGALGDRTSSLEKFSNNMQGRMWVIAAVVVIMEVALRFLGR